jgi:hypothetical protein
MFQLIAFESSIVRHTFEQAHFARKEAVQRAVSFVETSIMPALYISHETLLECITRQANRLMSSEPLNPAQKISWRIHVGATDLTC